MSALRGLVKEHTALMHLASDVSRLLAEVQENPAPHVQEELQAVLEVFRDSFWAHFEHEQKDLFPVARKVLGEPPSETDRLELEQSSLLELLDELCVTQTISELVQVAQRFFQGFEAHLTDKADFLLKHKYFLFPEEQMAG
ncbi:MAG: hypothetical protein GY822_32825 [Deltaproteobacteria bacterium]|nr:hypothetical protein [Deltaproteobacteria bacterium]